MSENKALISVVVPCFQVEAYLKGCIESIMAQSFKDFEVILVDDGSTDSTGKMCDAYAEQYSAIRVIHKANGGLSDARNAGIEHSNGEYICFVDSDDTLHPDYLGILYRTLIDTDSDISVCAYREVYEPYNGTTPISDMQTVTYSGKEAVRELILSDKLMNYAWNKLYKKELFSEVRYPVGKCWEDIGATYKLFEESSRVTYTNAPLYFYLRRKGSITASNNIRNFLDSYELLNERYCSLKDRYPELCDALRTQLCVSSFNCWSFLVTYGDVVSEEDKALAEKNIAFVNENGQAQLKNWVGYESSKNKIKLYFKCRSLLRFLIMLKRCLVR